MPWRHQWSFEADSKGSLGFPWEENYISLFLFNWAHRDIKYQNHSLTLRNYDNKAPQQIDYFLTYLR